MKYTRRKFITTLGAGSALLMLPAVPAFSKPLFTGDKKLGVALVGLGNYATYELAPALQETSLCYLNGIVTGTPAKTERWKKSIRFLVKIFITMKTLMTLQITNRSMWFM